MRKGDLSVKKEYIKPTVEIIDFQSKDIIMIDIGDGPEIGGGVGSGLWGEEE